VYLSLKIENSISNIFNWQSSWGSSTLFLTLAIDGMDVQRHALSALPWKRDPEQGAG